MPAAALVQQFFGVLMAQGNSELDHAALVTVLEEMAGQTLGTD